MALLKILTAPDPALKKVAHRVAAVDDAVRQLLDDMLETMYAAPGIGLAAPQVGVSRRVVVLDLAGENEPPAPLKLINPEIVWASDDDTVGEEGCLSVPTHYADVPRPAAVRVRHLDDRGVTREIAAEGLLARALQHEMDHLDGVLFIDHLSALKRNIILRKLIKAKKTGAEG